MAKHTMKYGKEICSIREKFNKIRKDWLGYMGWITVNG